TLRSLWPFRRCRTGVLRTARLLVEDRRCFADQALDGGRKGRVGGVTVVQLDAGREGVTVPDRLDRLVDLDPAHRRRLAEPEGELPGRAGGIRTHANGGRRV